MTIDEAVKHYGSLYRVCVTLGIKPQNGYMWKKRNRIPIGQQFRLAKLSNGVLKVDDDWPTHGNQGSNT